MEGALVPKDFVGDIYEEFMHHFAMSNPSSAAMWSVLMKMSKGYSSFNYSLIAVKSIFPFEGQIVLIFFLSSLIDKAASLNLPKLCLLLL